MLFGLILWACGTQKKNPSAASDVPLIGHRYGAVLDEIGGPEKSMGNLKLYAQKGLIYYTDPKEEQVIGLVLFLIKQTPYSFRHSMHMGT